MIQRRLTRATFVAGTLAATTAAAAPSATLAQMVTSTGTGLSFVLHASFFSVETKQPTLLDPQVFVQEAGATAGAGPQGIQHSAGLRPAHLMDPPGTPLFGATGKPLGITLGQWSVAHGSVEIAPPQGGKSRATTRLAALIPNARYSLFENTFSPAGVTFKPLDGTGTSNSFTAGAGGTATLTIDAPGALTHENAVLLVYHSDGVDHGLSRGQVGVTAHHQLIARP